MQEYIK